MSDNAKLDALNNDLGECSPYPGLRPFLPTESRYFKGRETQIAEIMQHLARERCVAVLGGSGCGKSSIVQAGVIPALRLKKVPGRGDFWRVAICNPGRAPVGNLIDALIEALIEGRRDEPIPESLATPAQIREVLYGADGLGGFMAIFRSQVLIESELDDDVRERANLLILIDQFEELFRDENRGKPEVAALAALIIDFWRRRDEYPGLYLVLTMRTDDLHRCAEFIALPDVINGTGYLTRRLTEEELRETIIAPVRPPMFRAGLLAGELAPGDADLRPYDVRVVTELLDAVAEIADDPDHLPLLQHLLAVLWSNTLKRWDREPAAEARITLEDLASALGFGTWSDLVTARNNAYKKGTRGWLLGHCLEYVAEQLYDGDAFGDPLTKAQQEIARCAFCLMGEVDDRGNFKRRWTCREEIALVAGLDKPNEDTERFIHRFTLDHRLLWDRGSEIDVSHESLMRKWPRLHDHDQWLKENKDAGDAYLRLALHYEEWRQANKGGYRWLSWFRRKNGLLSADNLEFIEPRLTRPRSHWFAKVLPKYNEYWSPRFLQSTVGAQAIQADEEAEPKPRVLRDAEFGSRFAYLCYSIRKNRIRQATPISILVAFLVVVAGFGWHESLLIDKIRLTSEQLVTEKERVVREKNGATSLAGFLLGENLLRPLRDVGLSELLRSIGVKTDGYLTSDSVANNKTSSNQERILRGLEKKNTGDLQRIDGNIAEALANFRAAEELFHRISDDDAAMADLARTLVRIGDALNDMGHTSEALDKHKEALKIRQGLKKAFPDDAMVAIEVADSYNAVGALQNTLGETTEAQISHYEAMSIALDHAGKSITHGAPDKEVMSAAVQPSAVALEAQRVLTDSILDTANSSWSKILAGHALILAQSIVRQKPWSAEARKAEAVTLSVYANFARDFDPSQALDIYRKVAESVDELVRWDPFNKLWRREGAATQLILSEGILKCLQDEKKRCKKSAPELSEVEHLTLDAISKMRVLTAIDPENVSWKRDLAWGLTVQATVLNVKKQWDNAIRAQNEAVGLYDRVAPEDPLDVNVKWGQATAYRDRAAILAEQKKYDEAVTDQQRAREILEGLVSAHMEHTGLRDELVKTLKKEIAYNRKIGNRVAVDVLERKEKEHQEILDRVLAAVPDTYDNVVWN
jgi:tetratricopeptide (TPR) repeat protein